MRLRINNYEGDYVELLNNMDEDIKPLGVQYNKNDNKLDLYYEDGKQSVDLMSILDYLKNKGDIQYKNIHEVA